MRRIAPSARASLELPGTPHSCRTPAGGALSADGTIFSAEAGTQAQFAMTRRYGARLQAVVGHGPDVVRHHRASGTVLSHQPSTAPTREGNVIANTPLPSRGHRWLTLEIGAGNCAGHLGVEFIASMATSTHVFES